MNDNHFFQEQQQQSQIKAEIVSKYFWAWSKVILSRVKRKPNGRIAYIDLFAGPGRYADGAMSTPLMVLKQAIADPVLPDYLVTYFNDKDSVNARSLEDAIAALPGVDKLRYKPLVYNHEVGENIVRQFQARKLVPTLFFVDPWGYKGLSLNLVNSVLKDWGSDCIFFFNYNRINMGLGNPLVEEHMNQLFGEQRAASLRPRLEGMTARQRELTIVEELSKAMEEYGQRYVLPFTFRAASGNRTSHHLIFVTKHHLGYDIMKGIMAKGSSSSNQGVPTFEYNPMLERQGLLFELSRPIDNLAEMLLDEFAGQTLKMDEIYHKHNVGRPYIKRNYKDVLLQLEADGSIIAKPSKRKVGTFADDVRVTFPPKSNTFGN